MVFFVIVVVFAFIGGYWAHTKGRNPVLWGIICGLFPVIGLVILAFQKPVTP